MLLSRKFRLLLQFIVRYTILSRPPGVWMQGILMLAARFAGPARFAAKSWRQR
jgi:hypothetical protein